jgi:hypothetical protein
MPTQKKNEFQPPMAERADLGFMDIILVFSGFSVHAVSFSGKLHEQGIVKVKYSL